MKTILFIDDNISIGKILKLYLETDGNKLVYFENAPAAIDWLNQGNRPTVIITDVYMPLIKTYRSFSYRAKKVPASASALSREGQKIMWSNRLTR